MEGTPAITSTDKTTYVQGDTIQYHGTGFTSFGAVEACLTLDIVFVRCFANEPNSDLFGNVAGSLNIATDWTTGQQELWLYDVATGTQSAGVPLTITALNNQLVVWFDSSPQVKSSSPCGYLFGAMAQTASGLLVTSLHWDLGMVQPWTCLSLLKVGLAITNFTVTRTMEPTSSRLLLRIMQETAAPLL